MAITLDQAFYAKTPCTHEQLIAAQQCHYRDPFLHEIFFCTINALKQLSASMEWNSEALCKLIARPPQFSLGQAALPCFPFAKQLKLSPLQIATKLSEIIQKETLTYIAQVSVSGGYLNFTMNFNAIAHNLFRQLLETGQLFSAPLIDPTKREKIVVEYSQPNTHKAMHIGHLRCLILGDAVCNLLERAGHHVVRATYPGDMGAHIAKALWYIHYRLKSQLPVSNKAQWLGEVYSKADATLKAELGTPQEEDNRKKLTEILHELHSESGEFYSLWKQTREWSFNYMKEIYGWLGCEFDIWFTESECNKPSVELVKQKFEEGFFKEDNGAIGIDLSEWKLGFAMYLKSDGNGLYITKDLELMRRKFADSKVTRSIYVVDARQKLHFLQLFKTGELMGFPQAAKSVHLSYETVNNEKGEPFSSRSLNALGLSELRQDMEEKVTNDYLLRYKGIWSEKEISLTARDVTIGALKYGLLKVDNNTQINFIKDEWLRLDGETGPYLQYVHARCLNILEKQGTPANTFEFSIAEAQEQELTFAISNFSVHILKAAEELRPSVLAGALYDLAKTFNRFYEACPIRTAEGDVKNSRLALVKLTAEVVKMALGILGIPALHKM